MRHPSIGLWIVWLALTLAASPVGAATSPLSVVLRDVVTIDSEDVHLGQIALVSGADEGLRQSLAAMIILPAPQPGETRSISAERVRIALQQCTEIPPDCIFGGAGAVAVTRGHTKVSAAELERLAVDHVLSHLPYPRHDVTIVNVSAGGDLILPRGRLHFDIRPVAEADYIGNVPLAVEAFVDGKPAQRTMVTVTSEVLAPVVMSRRPLARHQVIKAEDVVVGRMDLARAPTGGFSDPAQVVGQRASRMISAQTVVTGQMIENPPLVQRGDSVTILAENHGMRVTTMGKARQKGSRGDRIAVVNLDSQRTIYAQVVDERIVAVDF